MGSPSAVSPEAEAYLRPVEVEGHLVEDRQAGGLQVEEVQHSQVGDLLACLSEEPPADHQVGDVEAAVGASS